jgi:cytochrome b pre-mRNA-processing protein 3
MASARPLTKSGIRDAAQSLYASVVAQARQPAFYVSFGVADTVDGRFDMVALHAYLVLHRLKMQSEPAAKTAQAVFDTMFADMDRNLREQGVGDLGVGRRVKTMARAFYGRIAAYDEALAGDDDALVAALKRNLFRGSDGDPAALAALASYLRRETAALAGQKLDDILSGRVSFGAPPATSPEASSGAAAEERAE